jgi:hypothetical protein
MQRLLLAKATTPTAEEEELEEEGTTPLVWACRTGAIVAFDAVIAEDGGAEYQDG